MKLTVRVPFLIVFIFLIIHARQDIKLVECIQNNGIVEAAFNKNIITVKQTKDKSITVWGYDSSGNCLWMKKVNGFPSSLKVHGDKIILIVRDLR